MSDTAPIDRINMDTSSDSEYDKTEAVRQDEGHNKQVLEIARRFTTQSAEQHRESPFSAAKGGRLDPQSENFRAKEWARAFYNLRYRNDNAIPRVAGVAFKGLNVWGRGSHTDFQSTVGNTILKVSSLFGRGTQKIDILRDLDGLVLPGEQLCVLGPPGSVSCMLPSYITELSYLGPAAPPF
jgi:ATP-binding cassette, subfamily G (WHITE), member 2, PDR